MPAPCAALTQGETTGRTPAANASSISPQVDASAQVVYSNQNWFATYRGVSPEYFDIKRWYPAKGAVFTQDDLDRAADVCVIGRILREPLFRGEDPIGKVIRRKE